MFDPSKPFRTVDGFEAKLLYRLNGVVAQPLVVVVSYPDGNECVHTYTEDGCFYRNGIPSDRDLVNIPEETTRYYCVSDVKKEWSSTKSEAEHYRLIDEKTIKGTFVDGILTKVELV